jgi:hypothetical protein
MMQLSLTDVIDRVGSAEASLNAKLSTRDAEAIAKSVADQRSSIDDMQAPAAAARPNQSLRDRHLRRQGRCRSACKRCLTRPRHCLIARLRHGACQGPFRMQRRFTALEHEARVVLRTEVASEVRALAASSAEMVRSVVDERCNELRHAMIGQRCATASPMPPQSIRSCRVGTWAAEVRVCSELFERLERISEQRLHDVTIVVTESKAATHAALAAVEAAVAERLRDVEHRHGALQVGRSGPALALFF